MIFDKKGNNPVLTVSYLFKGLQLLGSPELRKFILIPILINVVLYSVALALGYFYVDELIKQFIPGWLQWLDWILWPLFFISFFIAGFFTFTVLANLLAAPFYGKLSSKTLAIITGQAVAGAEQPIAKVMTAELNRALYFVTRALPLLILSIIPGLNVIAPFLWALFGAWGMALEYMAYPLENAGLLFSEQKQLLKSVRLGALSFGGLAVMGLTIPVFNLIVAPAAVIGATIYFNEVKKD
ncbi:MAG: sulfate transporter CysZ [Methylococcaceae bacterium]